MKLADGPNVNEGRIEYCTNGRWGTLCGESLTIQEGSVICRQLGYNC